jgi:hypothetical protein
MCLGTVRGSSGKKVRTFCTQMNRGSILDNPCNGTVNTRHLKPRNTVFCQDFLLWFKATNTTWVTFCIGTTEMKRDLYWTRSLCSPAKATLRDVLCEINDDCYENYFVEQLLSNLPPQPFIVLDSAGYQSRKKEMVLAKSQTIEITRDGLLRTIDCSRGNAGRYFVRSSARTPSLLTQRLRGFS